ncbi:MAG: hypothetical protein J5554_09260 [Paludibacteraceae bacterium]|nr:hypothetical protein [Paludibacteraceae bacterium]
MSKFILMPPFGVIQRKIHGGIKPWGKQAICKPFYILIPSALPTGLCCSLDHLNHEGVA